jgi:GT2 family glycosyltransferase
MISVVVPVRDGLPWLEDQLQALSKQRLDEPWEIVVADNGSTDGSRQVVSRWARSVPSIRLVDASARRGAGAARNMGAGAARGEVLVFCDADDVVGAGWLEACTRALGEADVVAGAFDRSSLNGGDSRDAEPAATSQLGFLPAGLASNLAVRRQAFDAVGGFAEELLVGEDIDLCWRLQLSGYRFAVARDAVVARRERDSLGKLFRQTFAYGRCGPLLYRRHRGAGAHRDLTGAAKGWAWLVLGLLRLGSGARRREWIRAAGVRLGRIVGSFEHRVFFP